MARFGRFGKLPFRLGGEPSPQAKAFGALRALESATLGPVDDQFGDQTIDGAWHQAMAAGLGALSTFGEAAVWQAFPNTATDLIPEYERVLGVAPLIGASIESRREVVAPLWVGNIRSDYPEMAADLTAIDLRYKLQTPVHGVATACVPGKAFDAQTGENEFSNGSHASRYPNVSGDYFVSALLDVGTGVPATGAIGTIKSNGEQLLAQALPAWCDFNVVLHQGFTLDSSLLDCTGLS